MLVSAALTFTAIPSAQADPVEPSAQTRLPVAKTESLACSVENLSDALFVDPKAASERSVRNPKYRTCAHHCTNFVSQVLEAGGWRYVYGIRTLNDVWYANYAGVYSYTSGGAGNFYKFARIATSRGKYVGNVYNLPFGGVLQYKNKGSSAMNHTMAVTSKTSAMIYLTQQWQV